MITLNGLTGITTPGETVSGTGVWSVGGTQLYKDASGNLGLGVTPSAWYSLYKAYQFGIGGSLIGRSDNAGLELTANAYRNTSGNYIYLNTDYSTSYRQYTGQHQWWNSTSGTAGNAISFTQAMTLSAAGGLSVGTTSDAGAGNIWAVNSIYVGDGSVSSNAIARSAGTGTGFYFPAANTIGFTTNATERARIDASGNWSVGNAGIGLSNNNSIQYSVSNAQGYITHVNGTVSGQGYWIFGYNGSTIGTIVQNGTTGVTYNTSSDQRLKENIVDAPNALDSVNAIKVRSFDWKSDGSHVDYGYIAQELLTVAPESVSVPPDPDEMMGVDFGKLTPRLVKAIQELSAELNELKQKVNA